MPEAKSIGVAAVLAPERRAIPAPGLVPEVADAAAANLLTSDHLPDDGRPQGADRVLLVGLVWGGTTLVELEQVGEGETLTAGRLFDLPASDLPKSFRIVQPKGSGHVLYATLNPRHSAEGSAAHPRRSTSRS